jgi:hypothetical protein
MPALEELDAVTRGEAFVVAEHEDSMSVNIEWRITFTCGSRKAAAHIIAETEAKLLALTGTAHVPAAPIRRTT